MPTLSDEELIDNLRRGYAPARNSELAADRISALTRERGSALDQCTELHRKNAALTRELAEARRMREAAIERTKRAEVNVIAALSRAAAAEKALETIAELGNKTLIASPNHGYDYKQGFSVGARNAFAQCADIAAQGGAK